MMNTILTILIITFFATFFQSVYKKSRHTKHLKELEEEMRRLNEHLPALEQQKAEFVAIVSHQLRAPLTAIKGYTSMVLEGSFGAISNEIHEATNKLYISSEKIIALVENLITMSQIERGKMELFFESQNFVDFVKSVLADMEEKVKNAGLTLSFSIEEESKGILVNMDEKRLRHVVTHMIENAILYTPPPGNVHAAISVNDQTRQIRLSVADSGIGMTTEQIDALFKRFDLVVDKSGEISRRNIAKIDEKKQTKSTLYGDKAPGISTYVSKKIIHAHGGTFWAESGGANNGTTFIIELPFTNEK